MPSPAEPRKEHPSTYVVQDRSNEEELQRLTIQDTLMTRLMGGPLAEQNGTDSLNRVLDVGSGSGSWVLTTASTYPHTRVIGIDISQHMVEYARRQAEAQQLSDRVEFHVMDALRMLEFPDEYFDLVNLRFGISFLRTWDWPKLMSEMLRVCRPGGIIRVTESEIGGHSSNAPDVMRLHEMSICAHFRSGHLFEQKSTGLLDHLEPLLTRHGCENIQSKAYAIEIRGGTPEAEAASRDVAYLYRTTRPFLEKWGCVPKDYDTIYQQALEQMRSPEFEGGLTILTVWGTKP